MPPFATPEPTQPPKVEAAPSSEKTKYTEQWERVEMERMYKKFSAVVKPFEVPLLNIAIERINEIFKDKEAISIFEIGAGAGQHTKVILNGIAAEHTVVYTGIDVSRAQKAQFEETAKEFPETVSVSDYAISSWQDYAAPTQYDIVVAQHSWYGIGGDVKNFEKIKNALAEGGVCFILLNPPENVSQIAMENNGEQPFSSDGIEKGLTAVGLSYEKITSYSDAYTKEDFCKDGRLTQLGKDHFSYLYRKELQGDEVNVIKMIEDAPDESFRFPTDIFIARK